MHSCQLYEVIVIVIVCICPEKETPMAFRAPFMQDELHHGVFSIIPISKRRVFVPEGLSVCREFSRTSIGSLMCARKARQRANSAPVANHQMNPERNKKG